MTRWTPALALIATLLSACATPDAPPAVAGAHGSEGGIGGTGAPSRDIPVAGDEDTEGGIGGTGIFGTITSLGSIVVNGLTLVMDDGVVEPAGDVVGQDLPLAVGSTVLAEAERSEEGLKARRVALFLPLVGPVERVDPGAGTIRVMGTTVRFAPDALLVDRAGGAGQTLPSLGLIGLGDRVAVNGIWNGDVVSAGRIDRLDAGGGAALRGLLLQDGEGYRIGGTRLRPGCCGDLAAPAFVHAEGRYVAGGFEAETVTAGADLLFPASLDSLIVEAFLALDPDGQGFHLSGFGIPADQAASPSAAAGVRSLFIGRFDQAFRIDRSLALPDDREGRAEALRTLGDLLPPD